MRTTTVVFLAGVVLVFAVQTAGAQVVAGVYDVKFEEVSTNCTSPLRYTHGKLTIGQKGNSITVDIDRTPLMGGIPAKNGRVSAKSKPGGTMVEGMTGVFSVAGKVTPEGQLGLVMVGEYSANGKPLCTQTWNVSGPRADTPKPPKKSSKGSPRTRTSDSVSPVDSRERHAIMGDLVHLAGIGR
jgi:hypothetical protein